MKKKTLILIIGLINIFLSQAQSPVNSNYLIDKGISPILLDAAADNLLQEGSFTENIDMSQTILGKTINYKFKLIYDPSYKYGKDLIFVVDSNQFSKSELKKLKKTIEQSHQYSRLSRSYLYDESTLKLVKKDGGEIILEYLYQKNQLEPGLKKIKRFKGIIYIKNDQLERIVITEAGKPRKKNKNFERIVYFEPIENPGGYIVKNIEEKFTQKKGSSIVDYEFVYCTTEYKTAAGKELYWEDQKKSNDIFKNTAQLDTVTASLGWALPFLGKPATKLGYDLPRPVGLNVIRHQQTTNLQFTDLQIGFNDSELISLKNLFDLESSSLEESIESYMVRPDVWVFPFLNVYALVGVASANIVGNIAVDEETRKTIVGLAPFFGLDPNSIPTSLPLNIDVQVNTIGGGATLAGSVGDFVGTLNYQFVYASVPEANTATPSHVVMPLVGYRTSIGLNLMAGAMGQFYDTGIEGFAAIDGGDKLNYRVDFEPRRWNGMVGAYAGLGKHWNVMLNIGFGQRSSSTASIGYRF